MAFLMATTAPASAGNCPQDKPGKKYKVKIDSAPQGAAIYLGSHDCPLNVTTPWEGQLVNADYVVIVESPGYDPAQRPFKVARSRKVQELFIPMVKKNDPPKIDVRADADKNMFGATISLDGQPQGQAPMIITTTPGRHLVELKKEGFDALSQWVDLKDNQTTTLAPVLKEIAKPKFGTVVVDADIPDCEVYIDGNKHPDNTPAVINNVVEGLHVVEVRKAPGLPWKQTVQVTASQQTKVRAEMAATMNGGGGVVRVISDAPGARAFIDGTDMGPVPVDIKDVKTGSHIIQVKAPGFQTGQKEVMVAAGGTQNVKFDLNAETSGDQGTMKVVSPVPDADVFIDGASVGKVPQEKKLSAGEHFVVVKVTGYKNFEQKVRIEGGQAVTVSAELKAVGRLRVLSTPAKASVLINGLPAGATPLDVEVEVGQNVVRIELPGFQPHERTLNIVGGGSETISTELAVAGPSEAESLSEQRGLSSFGARTLPRGRSTVDFGAGYPYFLEGRISVGAGKIAHKYGFDANVGVRTMLARNELGLGVRMMIADAEPFSASAFTSLWWGSKLFDDSKRNGLTWDLGAAASLTALEHVTITGRAYLEFWSDRHCPGLSTTSSNHFDGKDPQQVCVDYYNATHGGSSPLSAEDKTRLEKVTGHSGDAFFDRDNGVRGVMSVIAEIAARQNWNIFGVFEFAPFETERALFLDPFAAPMAKTDYGIYGRIGTTYKF
jgi:hypothetical protein